jgi:ligand-binding sensor domain-containing protein
MKKLFNVILLLLAIQLQATELPKHPYYKEINHYFGLPSMHIYDLHVSKSGLLFLGTDNGLYSYDGIKFKSYKFKHNLANTVDRIQEDESGRIWCKNFSNQIFVLLGDELWVHEPTERLLSKLGANLGDYLITPTGLWIITEKELFHLDNFGKANRKFSIPKSEEANFIFAIEYDPNTKEILIGETNHLITILSSGKLSKTPLLEGQKTITLSNHHLFYAMKGKDNKLFVSRDKKKFNSIEVNLKNYIIKTSITDLGVWLCTGNGVYKINPDKKRVEFPFLMERKVTDVVQDHEGNLWFSTLGDGLIFVPSLKIQKINIPKVSNNRNIFTAINIDEQGHLYMGTRTGEVYELNRAYQNVRTYNTGKNKEIEHIDIKKNHVSTSDGRFDRQGNKINDEIKYYKDLAEDDMGNYVFGSFNLAGVIAKESIEYPSTENYFQNKELVLYGDMPKYMRILRNKRTRAVHFHKENRMYYVGASDGLFSYGPNNIEQEIRTANNTPIIAASIESDVFGNIWIGSLQNGIYKISNNQIVQHFDVNSGLSGEHTKKIHIDNSGIWIINDQGLDFIDLETNAISRMSRYSGLHGLDLFDITSNQTHLWLLTSEGLLFCDKSAFSTPYIPNLKISNVSANDQKIHNSVQLNHNQSNIVFDIQTTHYRSLGNYVYEYRLMGLNQNWKTQSANINQINYLALDPGNYTFEVRVRIGEISSPVEKFQFTIKKAFWMSTWFLVLVFFTLAASIYFIFKWRIDIVRRRQELREQLALSQITALRTQMNPHFMFNILNAFQGLIYSNQKTKANEYLGVFSDLMRKTLDISDKREISICEELEAIDLYISLEKARFTENEFEYILETHDKEELKKFAIPSLILQPFIENAIKHGLLHKQGEKTLKLSISKENNQYWRFEIQDNGIGRKHSLELNKNLKKHNSFATKAIDSRISLINRLNKNQIQIEVIDLKSSDNMALGTRVILKIPIKTI